MCLQILPTKWAIWGEFVDREVKKPEMKLGDWLAAEPFTLALSSSFFGFFAHAGVAAALESQGLRPQKVSGASAGALIAAAIGSGMRANEIQSLLYSIRREDFWDPGIGFGLLKGKLFQNLLEKNFVSEFDKAEVPFEVSAFDLKRLKTQFLGTGCVASAVLASCAVPGMFHPVKRENRILLDGGVLNKSGLNPNAGRALGIYFQSPGRWGPWEQRLAKSRLKFDQRFLVYQGLPNVSFNHLHSGPEAYARGLERTLRALELPLGTKA